MHWSPSAPNEPAPGAPREVLELTWEVFGELCRALAVKVANSGYEPELVVGIAKAGVIPGAVIASMLGCEFSSMKISRRAGSDRIRARPKVFSAAPVEAASRRVLIVDEICTTGDTLRLALASVRNVQPADVRTATSFVKLGGYKPDFFAIETDAVVIFPWDRHVVDEQGDLVVNPTYDGLL